MYSRLRREKGGFKVKFVNTPWEGIFNSLAQGDRDILISSVTITDTRKQTMDFSAPYFDSRLQIAIGKDSKVTRLADLKTLKVGVQTGTTGDEAVTKLQGKTSALIKRFESTPMALDELKAHGVDAVVGDNGVVEHYVANNGAEQLKIVEDSSFAPEQFGIVVKKGNTELWKKSIRDWLPSKPTAPTTRSTPNTSSLLRSNKRPTSSPLAALPFS
jgi:amino acid ABC transporter substrate-binding protein, PAAT family (TC 3.A.1.3.-)